MGNFNNNTSQQHSTAVRDVSNSSCIVLLQKKWTKRRRNAGQQQKTISHHPVSIEYLLCPHPFQSLSFFFTMHIRLEYFLDFSVRVFLPSKKESATVECHLTFASSRFGLWAPSSRVAAAWSSSDVSRSERNVVLGSFGIRSFGPSRSFQSCGQTCQRNVDKDNPEFFHFFVVTTAAITQCVGKLVGEVFTFDLHLWLLPPGCLMLSSTCSTPVVPSVGASNQGSNIPQNVLLSLARFLVLLYSIGRQNFVARLVTQCKSVCSGSTNY